MLYKLYFFPLMFVVIAFVSSLFYLTSTSVTSSYVISESSIKLAKYLPFPQMHVEGFQI